MPRREPTEPQPQPIPEFLQAFIGAPNADPAEAMAARSAFVHLVYRTSKTPEVPVEGQAAGRKAASVRLRPATEPGGVVWSMRLNYTPSVRPGAEERREEVAASIVGAEVAITALRSLPIVGVQEVVALGAWLNPAA